MTADLAIAVAIDGEQKTWRMGDLTGLDAKDFRAAVGMRLAMAFIEPDVDAIAGLWWLERRREENVTFEQVAQELNYDRVDFIGSSDPEPDPEAQGSSS